MKRRQEQTWKWPLKQQAVKKKIRAKSQFYPPALRVLGIRRDALPSCWIWSSGIHQKCFEGWRAWYYIAVVARSRWDRRQMLHPSTEWRLMKGKGVQISMGGGCNNMHRYSGSLPSMPSTLSSLTEPSLQDFSRNSIME
jgi:hypothetical protein